MKHPFKYFLLISLSVGVIGCTQTESMFTNTEAIATITAAKAGNQARLQGNVVEVAPFLKGGAYLLADESGEVWIVTPGELPAVGDTVKMAGEIVYTQVAIAEQQLDEIYINETQRFGEVSYE